jgi:hypothetical protein
MVEKIGTLSLTHQQLGLCVPPWKSHFFRSYKNGNKYARMGLDLQDISQMQRKIFYVFEEL